MPAQLRSVLALIASLSVIVVACTQAPPSDTSPKTFRIAVPSFGAESTAKWMGTLGMLDYIAPIYDPPIGLNQDGSLSKNGIISNWQFDSSGTTLTMKIRPGVKFHNGTEVTADDIKFTIETYSRQGVPATSAPGLRSQVTSMTVRDKNTLEVKLAAPNATFADILSWIEGDVGVTSKSYFDSLPGTTFEEKTAQFVLKPIGTGPFKFVSREVGKSIQFEANPDYYDKTRVPKFQQLIILKVTEDATRMNMLRTNQADVVEVGADQSIELQKDGFKPYLVKQVAHGGLGFIKSYDPSFITSDVRVRKALVLAVDRAAIVKSLFPDLPGVGATGVLAKGPFLAGPGVAGYRDDLPSYPYDPAEARRLLDDAGYLKNPKTIVAWSFTFSALPVAPKMLEAIAEYWKAVGVKVEIRSTEGQTIFSKLGADPQPFSDNDVDMIAAAYRPTGLNNLRVFAASHKLGLLMETPIPDKMDALILQATAISDPQKFDESMASLWRSIVNDYWALPIVWVHKPQMVNTKVISDYRPMPLSGDYSAWETLVPAGGK